MLLTILTWAATASVLVSYWWLTRTGRQRQFNIVNVVASFPLVTTAVLAARTLGEPSLYGNAALSVAFGVIGAWGLLHPPAEPLDPDRLLAGDA